jgi:hypothetical protein
MLEVVPYPTGMTSDNKDHYRQAFAARFAKALAELGHSATEQKALQRLFGVSGQAVRKWAEGLALPTPSRLPQVAKVLGVRRAWLQDGEEPMRELVGKIAERHGKSATKRKEITVTSEEYSLVRMYRSLTAPQRDALFKFVEQFCTVVSRKR